MNKDAVTELCTKCGPKGTVAQPIPGSFPEQAQLVACPVCGGTRQIPKLDLNEKAMTTAPREEITVEEIDAFENEVANHYMDWPALHSVCTAARRALSQAGGEWKSEVRFSPSQEICAALAAKLRKDGDNETADAIIKLLGYSPSPSESVSVEGEREVALCIRCGKPAIGTCEKDDTPQSVPADEMNEEELVRQLDMRPLPKSRCQCQACKRIFLPKEGSNCVQCPNCKAWVDALECYLASDVRDFDAVLATREPYRSALADLRARLVAGGRNLREEEREQTSVCPSCDGKKRIDGIMCGFCEGTGSIRNVFPPLPLTESREGDAGGGERIVLCEACGSEGRVLTGHPNDPHPHDAGPCPHCNGAGLAVIETEPVTEIDEPFSDEELAALDKAWEAQGETLPDCMMPDGADPCKGYQQLYTQLSAVKDQLAATKAALAEAEDWRDRWLGVCRENDETINQYCDECASLIAERDKLKEEVERLDKKLRADDAVIDGLELQNAQLVERVSVLADHVRALCSLVELNTQDKHTPIRVKDAREYLATLTRTSEGTT